MHHPAPPPPVKGSPMHVKVTIEVPRDGTFTSEQVLEKLTQVYGLAKQGATVDFRLVGNTREATNARSPE